MIAFLLGTPLGKAISGFVAVVAIIGLGLLWLKAHDAKVAADAKEGYVLLAEKTAAESKAAEIQRQLNASEEARKSLEQNIQADAAQDAQKDKDREASISNYEVLLSEANRRCNLTLDDRARILQYH